MVGGEGEGSQGLGEGGTKMRIYYMKNNFNKNANKIKSLKINKQKQKTCFFLVCWVF